MTIGDVSGISIISSDILEYDPFFTAWNTSGTNSSVMLTIPELTKWAQLGWLKHAQGGPIEREIFVQFFLGPSDNRTQYFPAKPLGTDTWYQVQMSQASTFDFYAEGGWLKRETGSLTPNQYQVMSETHDFVDQMPGGVNQHVTFEGTQYYAGGSWTVVQSTIFQTNPVIHAGSNPSYGRYDTWDKACAN